MYWACYVAFVFVIALLFSLLSIGHIFVLLFVVYWYQPNLLSSCYLIDEWQVFNCNLYSFYFAWYFSCYWLLSYLVSFVMFRRRLLPSRLPEKLGTRLWSPIVITQSLRFSPSGLEFPSDLLFCFWIFCRPQFIWCLFI